MDIVSVTILARELMQQHRLFEMGWRFDWNRGKKTLGLCNYRKKTIELSVHFVTRHNEDAVRDTLLHEIAHALAGPKAGHGPRWKEICIRIGAKPERLAHDANMPQGTWQATCPHCQTNYDRHRKPPTGAQYYCRPCGSSKGELVFSRTQPTS